MMNYWVLKKPFKTDIFLKELGLEVLNYEDSHDRAKRNSGHVRRN